MRLKAAWLLVLLAGCSPSSLLRRAPTSAHPAVTVPAQAARADSTPERRPGGGNGPVPTLQVGFPGQGGQGGGGNGDPAVRPYGQVITSRAVTREGLFKTHLIGTRLYFEIPTAELGKDMLLVTQIARNTADSPASFGGEQIANQVLRWERRDNRILLRGISYGITADSTLPIYRAVQAANFHPIIASFQIDAFGPDSAAVIEVTRLYTSGSPEFGLGTRFRGGLDSNRSFVERVASFPTNIEVEATQTYVVQPRPQQAASEEPQQPEGQRTASVLVHWSMVRLPEQPMMPRIHDSRVGYFTVGTVDYGTDDQGVETRQYITRWRLECAAGEVAPCEPVKPIVYYLDPATPEDWRPWIKLGIESWRPAFEKAGFRNAIVAKDPPSVEEDPDWSPEDARYSVIRWVPSPTENAMGPHVHDPRTGEILEADVLMFHNIIGLLRNWYFVQAGPLDPRARRLPLPDTLMGRLLQNVVAHEVGHTLGLPHNMKASSMYPADSIRSPTFLARMGHTPSIMDYSRYNYVAQPEDGVPLETLVPGIGPYDEFAVMWGYKPIAGIRRPEEEGSVLDTWALVQDQQPWLRFSAGETAGADLGDHTEAVGDADAVRSTTLGLRNLRRVVPMIIPATTRPAEDFSELTEVYGAVVTQWVTELNHVATLIGSVESQEKYGGQVGVRFTPVSRARQQEAMRFLDREAFGTPDFLLDPEILRRIEVQGALDRVGRAQATLLASLLDTRRMRRMVEYEALASSPSQVYTLADMLSELRRAVWKELSANSITVDALRRNLQRAYLELARTKINAEAPRATTTAALVATGDERALLRGELRSLDATLRDAIPRAADRTTRLHLEDAREQIGLILDPR